MPESHCSSARSLELLEKFEKIKGLGLNLAEKYERCLAVFDTELENLRKMFNRDNMEPPIPRNQPPYSVSGTSFCANVYDNVVLMIGSHCMGPSAL